MKQTHLLAAGLIGSVLFFSEPLSCVAEPSKRTVTEERAEFAKADKALNDVYEVAKKKLVPYQFEKLRANQRVWLEFRENLALTPSYAGVPDDEANPKSSRNYFSALVEITKARIEWIKAGWIAEGPKDDLTASWRDSHGGCMDVVEDGHKLYFVLDVVRGRSANLGWIAGTAEWYSNIGWFSDRDRHDADAGVAHLAFVARDRSQVEVLSDNAGNYGGKGVYFDGHYIKVGQLDEAAKARVIKVAESGVYPEEPVPSPSPAE